MNFVEATLFLVLALLPGFVLAITLGSRHTDYLLALPLSCGVVYVISSYSSLFGIAINSWWYGVLIVLLLTISIFQKPWMRLKNFQIKKVTIIGIALSSLIGLLFILMWLRAAGHVGQLLPNHDAMYHSYVIRNIVDTHSTKASEALRLFPIGAGTAANFYPLGLHSLIAIVTQMSGISINGGMNLVTLLLAIGVFPISMWIWTRELLRDTTLVAIFTPVSIFLVSSIFPFSPMSWGGMPAIVGMCVAPLIAVTFAQVLLEPSLRGISLITVALVGIFSIHTTELILVFLLTGTLLARRGATSYLNMFKTVLKVAVGACISLAPVTLATAGGASERSLVYQTEIDAVTTIGQSMLFSFPGFVLTSAAILLAIGIIGSNRNRESIATWGLVAVLLISCLAGQFPENFFIRLITKPWYGQVLRLNYNIVYFAVPILVSGLIFLISKNKNNYLRIFSSGMAIALVVTGALQVQRADSLLLDSWYNGLVPTNQNSVSAFQWMASQLDVDEYVISDFDGIDGSTWMYALSGARPTMYGAITDNNRDKWRDEKIEVISKIGELEFHPELLTFLNAVGIRFIYFDERTNAISPQHSFSLEDLRNDAALSEVFVSDNAHVFEIIF